MQTEGKPRKRAVRFTRFRNRYVTASIVAGLLPALVLSLIFVYTSRDNYRRELTDAYHLALTRLETSVDSMLEYLCRNTMDQMVLSDKIQDILIGADDENDFVAAADISREIGKYRQATSLFVDLLRVYTTLPDRPLYGQSVSPIESVAEENWYKMYLEQTDGYFYHTKRLTNPLRETTYPTLTLVQPIVCTDFYSAAYRKTIGLARMDVNVDVLFSRLLYGELQNMSGITAAFSPAGEALFLSDPAYERLFRETALPLLAGAGDGYTGLTLSSPDAYLASTRTSRYGIRILMLFEQAPLSEQFLRFILPALLMLCMSALAVAVLSLLMSRKYGMRMETLFHKMALVRHGDFSETEPKLGGTDELAVLDEQFNYMVTRLRETINRSYVLELDKKDAQLRALQLQINPHFLYNTLESLSVITLMRGQTDVSDALEKLGRLFRYGVTRESREQVTVREEITHVSNYISIQQLRFPDCIDVYYNVPPETGDLLMPFFILQPIVENAILHGLCGGGREGTIEISALREENDLLLTVEDDGVGMTDAQREALTARINDFSYNATSSIGLQNVHSRLRLMYGEKYGLFIESSPGRGTRVTARIPVAENDREAEHA